MVHGVAKSRTRLGDFAFTFHFHALEKDMATHSSVLAWRIPGTRSLVGCRLWGRTGSDTTEATQQQQQQRVKQSRTRRGGGILAFTLELVERSLKDSEEWRAMTQPVPSVMRMGCLSALQKWESGAR